MKSITIVLVLAGLLLCGCEGGKNNASVTDSPTAVTTTVSESNSGTTETKIVTTADKPTKAKETATTAQSGTTNTSADKADIAISGASAAVTTDQPSERENAATVAQAVTDQPQQTTTETTASEKEAEVNSDNILPDDGLNWSPLVPVN